MSGRAQRHHLERRLQPTQHLMEPNLSLRPHLRIETVGDEILVLDGARQMVHRISGDAAVALHHVANGREASDLPRHLDDAVESLRDAGLLDGPPSPSRRRLLRAGLASAAAIGVTTLTLPSAAAAASIVELGGGGGGGVFYSISVVEAGSGGGRVTSNPVGIDTDGTPATTSSQFGGGSTVTLTATADADSTFEGWSGDVTSAETSIDITVSTNTTVTATFTAIALAAAAAGNGQVTLSWDEA